MAAMTPTPRAMPEEIAAQSNTVEIDVSIQLDSNQHGKIHGQLMMALML
jgi:hypothetical protein